MTFEPLDRCHPSVFMVFNVMSELDERIGQQITAARKAAGLTQEQLAEAAGIAAENLSRAERGKTVLRTRNLIAIAEVLGVSLDDLVRGKRVTPRRGTAVARLVRLVGGVDEGTARQVEKVVRAFLVAVEARRRVR
jgi:transcriptional regulator with XRE-family HTH domain